MGQLRFGAADYTSNRPLLHGLVSRDAGVRVSFEPPGALVESFARGRYDAALVPSIEYLRGVGRSLLAGPALIGRAAPGGGVLLAQKPLDELERVAVGEFSRTAVAALRITLAEQHHVFADLMVEKRLEQDDWRDRYDAALITGDAALREMSAEKTEGLVRCNLTEMWKALTKTPLVHAVWVYDDDARGDEIARVLRASRDLGVSRLSAISEEAARTLGVETMVLYDYFTRAWSYDLGERELEGLRALNDFARKYNLIRDRQLVGTARV